MVTPNSLLHSSGRRGNLFPKNRGPNFKQHDRPSTQTLQRTQIVGKDPPAASRVSRQHGLAPFTASSRGLVS